MIEAVDDPEIVNRFVNHPDIHSHFGGAAYLDLTAAVNDPNVFLFGEHGGFCFSWSAPRTFEIHVAIMPEGRGKWAFRAAAQALEHMDEISDHLWARVNPVQFHTAFFTRKHGFKHCGFNTLDLGQGPVRWDLYNRRIRCHQP